MVKRHTSSIVCSVDSKLENEYAKFSDKEYSKTPANCLLQKSGGKFASWNYKKMRCHCIIGVDVTASDFVGGETNKLKFEYVLVTRAMLEYGFSILLDEDIEKLCRFFDCFLIQLSNHVVLIYKWAKILEKDFGASFIFKETIHLFFLSPKPIVVGGTVG